MFLPLSYSVFCVGVVECLVELIFGDEEGNKGVSVGEGRVSENYSVANMCESLECCPCQNILTSCLHL